MVHATVMVVPINTNIKGYGNEIHQSDSWVKRFRITFSCLGRNTRYGFGRFCKNIQNKPILYENKTLQKCQHPYLSYNTLHTCTIYSCSKIYDILYALVVTIRKTSPYNVHPLKPHFYIENLEYTEVYLYFLFLRGGSNVYPQSML